MPIADHPGPSVDYAVPDISCEHCRSAITASVGAVPGVEQVTVDLDARTVSVVTDGREPSELDHAIRLALDDAGYDVA